MAIACLLSQFEVSNRYSRLYNSIPWDLADIPSHNGLRRDLYFQNLLISS